MSKKIRVVMCPVDRAPYVTNVSDTLENLQKIVGGYIETVGLTKDCILVCNEEGRLKELPENPSVWSIAPYGIRGDCFFCGVDGEEFADIPDKGIKLLLKSVKECWKWHTEESNE